MENGKKEEGKDLGKGVPPESLPLEEEMPQERVLPLEDSFGEGTRPSAPPAAGSSTLPGALAQEAGIPVPSQEEVRREKAPKKPERPGWMESLESLRDIVPPRPLPKVLPPVELPLPHVEKVPLFARRLDTYTLMIFTKQLATLYASGVPLIRSLALLTAQPTNRALHDGLLKVTEKVRNGASFGVALAPYPHLFPPIYAAMVKAGETIGDVPGVLTRIGNYLERELYILRKVKQAMTYPIVVLIVALLIFFFMIKLVFPTFIDLFASLNVPLPLLTRFLLAFFKVLQNPFAIPGVLTLGVLGALLVRKIGNSRRGRLFIDERKLKLPKIGEIHKKVVLSRFARSFGTLYLSGISVLHALEVARKACGNEYFASLIQTVIDGVRAGVILSQTFEEVPFFPRLLTQMVRVGEEAGMIGDLLIKVADSYEMDADYALTALTSVLEPILMAGMGIFVGVMVVGFYLPLYQFLSALH